MNLNIPFFVLLTFLGLGLSSFAQQSPNIILIMADDLGYEALPMYGNDLNQTPNLEKMAAGGMLFEHCYSTPLCTPSRVQIMTGKYNFRNYTGFGILNPLEETFAHMLKSRGYSTCVVGKWQLYGNQRQRELAGGKPGALPEEAGFDDYRLWQVQERGSRYKNPHIDTRGEGVKTYLDQYGPDLFIEYIEQYMENHIEGPFFLYYPMVLTHDPFEPTPLQEDYKTYDPEQRTNDPQYFPEMVRYMDMIIGRIVQKTRQLGIADHTLILFVGDNGTDRDVISHVNNTEIRGNKGFTTNYSTHVPMIAYWPRRIRPGSRYEGLIDFTDFVPTILDVTQTDWDGELMGLDGISFYPVLMGDHSPKHKREWVFCQYDPRWGNFQKRRFVHDTQWKLYENGEIFNVENDLEEMHPLKEADLNPEERSVIQKFRSILNEMR